jgi:hypothetical protein
MAYFLSSVILVIADSGASHKNKKGRAPVPGLQILNWLRGPATPRKRHSLILPYRFELIREVAA